ncbi:MAG: hypothetical protein ACE5H4_08640 [Candidatus Thorarchaeota archaeon]
MSECPVCGRQSDSENALCQYHNLAMENLQKEFEVWKRALDIDWESYLDYVYALESLGTWVRDVIDHIRSVDDSSEMSLARS